VADRFYFEIRLTDILVKNNRGSALLRIHRKHLAANKLILATGHSARDIFELLDRKQIFIEAKTFAWQSMSSILQTLIDSIQYSCDYQGLFTANSSKQGGECIHVSRRRDCTLQQQVLEKW
jgi:uncharacterized FAD-dependent dehydrogenase